MNSRNFVGSLLASAAAVFLPWRRVVAGPQRIRTFKVSGLTAAGELIDIKTWHARGYRRLFLNGEDVTCLGFACHTGEGWVDCLVREPLPPGAKPGQLGKTVRGPWYKVLHVRRYGRIEIR